MQLLQKDIFSKNTEKNRVKRKAQVLSIQGSENLFFETSVSLSQDSSHNPDEFPRRFNRGAFEGFWWAIVTITTIG